MSLVATGCAVARSTRTTITAWPWRSRSPPWAPADPPRSTMPALLRSRIRSSSRCWNRCARERGSVATIFAQSGESYFRQQERQVLSDLLPQRQIVVATGGGTFAEPDNRALMLADGAVAWIDVPLTRVFERVPADGRRPLAADRTQMEQLYARRRLAYAEAHVRVDGSEPVPEVVARLLEWVGF